MRSRRKTSNAGDRALLVELGTLNKQIAAFAWHLLGSNPSADEQFSLADQMQNVGKLIRNRVEKS